MDSLTNHVATDLAGYARLLHAGILRVESSPRVDRAVDALNHFYRHPDNPSLPLMLYVREVASALLGVVKEQKTVQACYRFLFAIDDELGVDRVVSLRALATGIRRGTHVLVDVHGDSPPQLRETGPIVVLTGNSPLDVIEVRDHVARLRMQYVGRQIVSFLGGMSEIAALAVHNSKFSADAISVDDV
jgi:hypothetical protein